MSFLKLHDFKKNFFILLILVGNSGDQKPTSNVVSLYLLPNKTTRVIKQATLAVTHPAQALQGLLYILIKLPVFSNSPKAELMLSQQL